MSIRTTPSLNGVPSVIQSRLEAAGLRRTLATRAVLGLFLAQPSGGLTHAQALSALNGRGLDINRVTLYRLLDRLAACGVLQRQADEQRIWRFRLAPTPGGAAEQAGAWARFECDACHRAFGVTEGGAVARAASDELLRVIARLGHHGQRVDLAVHGTCADCSEPAA